MAAILFLGRLDHGVDADDAGIQLLGDTLDYASLAGGIGAFEDENDVALALENLSLEMEELELQLLHLFAVLGFVVDLLGEVEVVEQSGHTTDRMSNRGAVARRFVRPRYLEVTFF